MPTVSPSHPIFLEIDTWYQRVPEDVSPSDAPRWVQRSCEMPCPECGELLWVMRTERAENRGFYHLAMCQNPDCTFQIDD